MNLTLDDYLEITEQNCAERIYNNWDDGRFGIDENRRTIDLGEAVDELRWDEDVTGYESKSYYKYVVGSAEEARECAIESSSGLIWDENLRRMIEEQFGVGPEVYLCDPETFDMYIRLAVAEDAAKNAVMDFARDYNMTVILHVS